MPGDICFLKGENIMFPIDSVYFELECMLRVVIAAFCGMLVGIERKNRLKEAGTRTHLVVCFASAIFMIVSKYGFFDIANYVSQTGSEAFKVDASRIASTVVTGMGFLGAGTIFVRRQVINGLTTAAGLWATSAIGMAFGAGQYILGLLGTICLVFFQWLLHRTAVFNRVAPDVFIVKLHKCENPVETLRTILDEYKIKLQNVKFEKGLDDEVSIECLAKIPFKTDMIDVSDKISQNPNVKYFEY